MEKTGNQLWNVKVQVDVVTGVAPCPVVQNLRQMVAPAARSSGKSWQLWLPLFVIDAVACGTVFYCGLV